MKIDELAQGMRDMACEEEMLLRWKRDDLIALVFPYLPNKQFEEFANLIDELVKRACCYESSLIAVEAMWRPSYERVDFKQGYKGELEERR
jgi:hypothetical protein